MFSQFSQPNEVEVVPQRHSHDILTFPSWKLFAARHQTHHSFSSPAFLVLVKRSPDTATPLSQLLSFHILTFPSHLVSSIRTHCTSQTCPTTTHLLSSSKHRTIFLLTRVQTPALVHEECGFSLRIYSDRLHWRQNSVREKNCGLRWCIRENNLALANS